MKKLILILSFLVSIAYGQNLNNTNFNRGFPFNNYSFCYGTSITIGLVAEPYFPITMRQLSNVSGLPNYAVSSTAERTALRQLGTNQGLNLQGACIGDPIFNMSRWAFNNPQLDSTHLFAEMKAGYRALTAFQFTDTIQFYRVVAGTVNSNVTTSQSAVSALALDTLKDFGSRAVFFGTNIWWKPSITANETYTNTKVRGTNLIIGVWADSIGGSRIQYAVDGTTIGTYDPNGRANTFDLDVPTNFHRQGFINDAIVINGLKDTLHTVVLTFLDGGKFGGVDYIGNMKQPQIAALAPIYMIDPQHMNSTGYAATGGSLVVQDSAANSRWADQVNNFSAYIAANAIVRINVNIGSGGHFDPNDPTQLNSDGIHPLGPGYRNYVIDIMKNVNPKASLPLNQVPGTNGLMLYSNNGSFGFTPNFTFDGTHLTIGNLGVATDDISVRHDQSGGTFIRSWNGTSTGFSGFQSVNDNSQSISVRAKGSSAGSYGAFVASSGAIYSTLTSGLVLMQDNNAPISFATGTGAPAATRFAISGTGDFTFQIGAFNITEGVNGRVGQVSLTSGTKAVTISGLTTASRAIVTLVAQGGTVTTTINYAAVCTSNTLTITALTSGGTTDTTDTSTINYFVINSMNDWIALAIVLGLIRPFFRRRYMVLKQAA